MNQRSITGAGPIPESGAGVLYHGTLHAFDRFERDTDPGRPSHRTARMGFFFSSSPNVASMFAGTYYDDWPPRQMFESGANIRPVRLRVALPYVLAASDFLNRFVRGGEDPIAFTGEVKSMGHDGIVVPADSHLGESLGGEEYGADTWIVFAPEQIESVF